MTTPSQPSGRSLAQRLAVQMQVHLPGTVGRLLKVDFVAVLRQICPGVDTVLPSPELPHLREIVIVDGEVPAA